MQYLFWAYLIIWGLLFGYVVYLDYRQRSINNRLKQLTDLLED